MQIEMLDTPIADQLIADSKVIFAALADLDLPIKIATINAIREALREHSPFKSEPVDCVSWVPAETVTANDYNPTASTVIVSAKNRQLSASGCMVICPLSLSTAAAWTKATAWLQRSAITGRGVSIAWSRWPTSLSS